MTTTYASKLAQVATGSRTCSACGRTKGIEQFPIHPRWGSLMKVCESCMEDKRKMASKKRLATMERNRKHEREIAQVNREAALPDVNLLLVKLDGYAMAVHDDGHLAQIVQDLRRAL